MQRDVQAYLDFAKDDLTVAKHLRNTLYPMPMGIICYHCQQCAEKAIKALFLFFEMPGGIPRKHDLWFLLEQIKNKAAISEELYDYADALNAFSASVRYPSEDSVSAYAMEKSILYAEEIYAWAEGIVKA